MHIKTIASNIWISMDFRSTTVKIIGIGLLIRITALISLAYMPLSSDSLGYHTMAVQLSNGENFSPYWPPGLPYYLSFFYSVFGVSELAGRVSMLLFYLLFSIFLFLLTKEISSAKAANLSILIFAVFPTYIFHSVETLTQLPTATYLVIIAYYTLLIKNRYHWFYPILLGLMVGLLILTRPSSMVVLGLIPPFILIKTRKLTATLVPVFLSLLIVFIWVNKAHQMTDRWIRVNEASSVSFFNGNNQYTPLYKTWWFASHGKKRGFNIPPGYSEMLAKIENNPPEIRDKLFRQTAFDHIKTRPDLFLIRTLNRIRVFFAFDTFTGSKLIKFYSVNKLFSLMVLLLDALFYCVIMMLAIRYLFGLTGVSSFRSNAIIILLISIGYSIPYWFSFSHPTYHFPIVPLLGGVFSAKMIERLIKYRLDNKTLSWLPDKNRKYLFLLSALFFIYIQIEWIVIMWSRI